MRELDKENGSLIVEEDTQKGLYLTFKVGNEDYGIEIKYVIEIIGIQNITEVPGLPNYIMGIINLRGKIIPVIDVRLKFRKQWIEYNDRTCIVVVDMEDISVGLIVDNVVEVVNIPESEIVNPPETKVIGINYIKGIGKVNSEVKLLIDCEKLLNEKDVDNILNI